MEQASKKRLEEVQHELAELEEKLKPRLARYEAEKRHMEELRGLQKKREELKVKLAEAELRYDLAMVADIKYVPPAKLQALVLPCYLASLLCRRSSGK